MKVRMNQNLYLANIDLGLSHCAAETILGDKVKADQLMRHD